MSHRLLASIPAFAAALLLTFTLGGFLTACSKRAPEDAAHATTEPGMADQVTLSAEQLTNAELTVVAVRREMPSRRLALTGSIAYDERRTARVAPRITGRVVRLAADLGDRVARGAVLAVLDSPDLGEAQAEYLTRLADHAVARQALERARGLVERKAIAQGEVIEREGAARRAEAALGFAENRLHLLDMSDEEISRLGAAVEAGRPPHGTVSPELVLRSPIAGTVTRLEASPEQAVERLQTLFVVSDLSGVWAWLDVYERDLAHVSPGTRVEVTAEALPGARFPADVDFVGEVEPETRAARVRARVTNPGQRLRPGMFVRAAMAVPESGPAVLLIPREAVQELEGRAVAFREQGEGTFRVVPVDLGARFDDLVEVRAGLAEGDRVAASGAFTLKGALLRSELSHEDH